MSIKNKNKKNKKKNIIKNNEKIEKKLKNEKNIFLLYIYNIIHIYN